MQREARFMAECRHPNIMPALALLVDTAAPHAQTAIVMPRASHDLYKELQ
jgi:hypothetical protein